MHISEGILSPPVLLAGWALAAAGTARGVRKLDHAAIPRVALMSAALFVASLVHVPIGPSSVHLILNGLAGALLGWAAFPAFLVALTMQAILFQFGGLVVLGVNTVNVALPAVGIYFLLGPWLRGESKWLASMAGFAAGALAVLATAILTALSLYLSGEGFAKVALALLAAHLPVAAVEGVVTASVVGFLRRVRPEVLLAV